MKRFVKARSQQRAAAHAFDKVVGNNIRNRRTMKGLTLSQLADEIGKTGGQVSRYESGDNSCEPYTLSLIAGALGCKVQVLVGNAGDEK